MIPKRALRPLTYIPEIAGRGAYTFFFVQIEFIQYLSVCESKSDVPIRLHGIVVKRTTKTVKYDEIL